MKSKNNNNKMLYVWVSDLVYSIIFTFI